MKRSIKIGEHSIPLWLVVVLLISVICIGVLGYHIWRTIIISVEIKEPLEIVSYPSKLSLYPGETEEFNVTVMNRASVDYFVALNFSLDNTTYQERYVTFSDEIYNVIPGQQDLLAWLKVEPYAPPINTSLTIDFLRIEESFFDDFSDKLWTEQHWAVELGNFEVTNGKYFTHTPMGEESYAAVNNLNFTDGIIEVKLRFTDAVGFQAWIFFRHNGVFQFNTPDSMNQQYDLYLSAEYDTIGFGKAIWGDPLGLASYTINLNVDYTVRVEIIGWNFKAFINGEQVLSVTDGNHTFTNGKIGLAARCADVFFDDFTVWKK